MCVYSDFNGLTIFGNWVLRYLLQPQISGPNYNNQLMFYNSCMHLSLSTHTVSFPHASPFVTPLHQSLETAYFTHLVSSWLITDEGCGILPTVCLCSRNLQQVSLIAVSDHCYFQGCWWWWGLVFIHMVPKTETHSHQNLLNNRSVNISNCNTKPGLFVFCTWSGIPGLTACQQNTPISQY